MVGWLVGCSMPLPDFVFEHPPVNYSGVETTKIAVVLKNTESKAAD